MFGSVRLFYGAHRRRRQRNLTNFFLKICVNSVMLELHRAVRNLFWLTGTEPSTPTKILSVLSPRACHNLPTDIPIGVGSLETYSTGRRVQADWRTSAPTCLLLQAPRTIARWRRSPVKTTNTSPTHRRSACVDSGHWGPCTL